jgi:hypothetical protein
LCHKVARADARAINDNCKGALFPPQRDEKGRKYVVSFSVSIYHAEYILDKPLFIMDDQKLLERIAISNKVMTGKLVIM